MEVAKALAILEDFRVSSGVLRSRAKPGRYWLLMITPTTRWRSWGCGRPGFPAGSGAFQPSSRTRYLLSEFARPPTRIFWFGDIYRRGRRTGISPAAPGCEAGKYHGASGILRTWLERNTSSGDPPQQSSSPWVPVISGKSARSTSGEGFLWGQGRKVCSKGLTHMEFLSPVLARALFLG